MLRSLSDSFPGPKSIFFFLFFFHIFSIKIILVQKINCYFSAYYLGAINENLNFYPKNNILVILINFLYELANYLLPGSGRRNGQIGKPFTFKSIYSLPSPQNKKNLLSLTVCQSISRLSLRITLVLTI